MDSGDSPVIAIPHAAPDDAVALPAMTVGTPIDLDAIEADLAGVEIALARLEDGSYWTCEVTGQPLPDGLLAANPVARRLSER
jgi:RNA polymerase-binding transcription factor DksA